MRFRDTFGFLRTGDDWAWFDYATGIIFSNNSIEEFARVERLSNEQRTIHDHTLIAALAHEHVHMVQTCSTPYLANWSSEWRSIISELITELPDAGTTISTLQDLLALVPNDLQARAQEVLTRLTAPSHYGLTVRDLIEGQALFAEIKQFGVVSASATAEAYFDAWAPATEYRIAYDLMRLLLGEELAYRAFHPVVTLSLYTEDPVLAFKNFIGLMLDYPVRPSTIDDPRYIDVMINTFVPMGIAQYAQGAINGGGEGRGLAREWVDFWKGVRDGSIDFHDYLLGELYPYFIDLMTPFIVYASNRDTGKFASLSNLNMLTLEVEVDGQSVSVSHEDALHNEFRVATIARILTNELLDPAEDVRDKHFAWMTKISSKLVQLRIPLDQIVKPSGEVADRDDRPDFSSMLGLSSRSDPLTEYSLTILGRAVLSFDLDIPGHLAKHPAIRQIVFEIDQEMPYFPLFLCNYKSLGMGTLWLNCLMPMVGWSGNGFIVNHPSIDIILRRAYQSAERVESQLGISVKFLLDHLFKTTLNSRRTGISDIPHR